MSVSMRRIQGTRERVANPSLIREPDSSTVVSSCRVPERVLDASKACGAHQAKIVVIGVLFFLGRHLE